MFRSMPTAVAVAAMLGLEGVPYRETSRGIFFDPPKLPTIPRNDEQRKADAEAKRQKRAAKLAASAAKGGIQKAEPPSPPKLNGMKATQIWVDECVQP